MAVVDERIPALSAAISKLLNRRFAEVHTCLPGRITQYNKDTQLADVEVCVKHRTPTDDGEIIVEDFPVIPNVPVDVAQTAGFFASFPVAVGDFVWLHIVEQSIDKWMDKGGVKVNDPIERRFNLTDCFATLARNPKSPIAETESDAMVLGPKGSGPRVYLTDSIIGLGSKAPTNFVGDGTKVTQQLTDLKTAINSWTAIPNDGGAALKVALTTWLASSSDVRLTKVKGV